MTANILDWRLGSKAMYLGIIISFNSRKLFNELSTDHSLVVWARVSEGPRRNYI